MSRLRNAFRALTGTPDAPARRVFTGSRSIGRRSLDVIGDLLGRPASNGDRTLTALNSGEYFRLRSQARQLERTSPLVARYVRVRLENVWGPDGITLQATPPLTRDGSAVNGTLSASCESVWYQWCETADVSGGSLDDAMQWFEARLAIDGEAALEIVRDSRLFCGVGVRRIDADLINHKKKLSRKPGQNAVDRGVELDANGKPVAYYILSHRSDEVEKFGPVTERRVDAALILMERHGDDVRGVSPLVPALSRLDDLNGLQEAVVAGHRAAACQMGFFTSAADSDPMAPSPGSSFVNIDVQSGVTEQLPAGVDFKPWVPGAPGAQYRDIYVTEVHEFAASVGVTYVSITGDLTEANYSSMRQGELQARESYRVEHKSRARKVLQPLYTEVLRGAVIAGRVSSPLPLAQLARAVWHGRTWPWVDPKKDAEAIRELLALGLTTRTRELNALGLAATGVFRELADEIALLKSLDIPTEITTVQAQAASADATASRPRLTA
jgi:lambda family phage portal protein